MTGVVELKVGGRAFSGWKQVGVTRALGQAAAAFTIGVSERFPGDGGRLPLRPGDVCALRLGGDLVVTGAIDRIGVSVSAASHSRRISGRSATADLVDASVLDGSGQFKNRTAAEILARLLAPHGAALAFEVDPGAALANFDIENGERVFEAIDRLLRLRGLLACDTPGGALRVPEIGAGRAQGALELRRDGSGNVLESSVAADAAERFSEIRVRGQRAGSDQEWGETVAAVEGRATDQGVTRFRPLVLPAPGAADSADCARVAAWEIARRAGRALEASYTVPGWRQSENGPLWTVGDLVSVRDDPGNIAADLVLDSVTFSLGSDGTKSRLALKPAEAYLPQPQLTPASGSGVGSGYWAEIRDGV